MTPEFYREYLREQTRKRLLLYCMNPNKFQACQFLIKYHEDRGDKVIVFSDNVYALEVCRYQRTFAAVDVRGIGICEEARETVHPWCHRPEGTNEHSGLVPTQPTSQYDFPLQGNVTVALKRQKTEHHGHQVGDTSIDLPEATCLIQISSHFGSRRQEAQRLG
jgi:DNA excision repair protein ERCC-3